MIEHFYHSKKYQMVLVYFRQSKIQVMRLLKYNWWFC